MLKGIRTPVLWSGINLLLLLFILVPPIWMLLFSFTMIPIVILYVKLEKRTHFALWYAGSLLIACLLTGQWLILPFVALFQLIPSLVIGHMYKRRASARAVLTAGIVTILAQLVVVLGLITANGTSIRSMFDETFQTFLSSYPEELKIQFTDEIINAVISTLIKMLPLFLICTAFYWTVLTHWIGRAILSKLGENVPKLKPIREWMLPKSLVWYYLIALILDWFFTTDGDGMMSTILMNLIPLLMFAFSVQGIAFLFFVSYEKKWTKALPIAGIVLFVFFPPSHYILSLLGVFDVAFPIRNRFINQ